MFSQTTEYALRAMSWMAVAPDALVSTHVLAEKTKVPPHYLAKVLQHLSAANLIVGRRGVRGGYKLSRPPKEITLLDVVRSVAEVRRVEGCPLGLPGRGGRLCALHRATDAAAKAVIEIYGAVTLADLTCEGDGRGPLCEAPASTTLTVSASGSRK